MSNYRIEKPILARYGNIIALLFGLFASLIVLMGLEKLLHMRSKTYRIVTTNFSDFIVTDAVLGNRGKANYTGTNVLEKHGDVVYEATYTLDEAGYRYTPVSNPESRTIDALFFGCSFTFGLGVADDETIPAVVSEALQTLLPMNFALFGYGPQHFYLQLQAPEFPTRVRHKKGIALYTMLGDHHNRLSGYASWGDSWANLPRLVKVEEEFEHNGFFGNPLDRLHVARFVLHRTGYYLRRETSETDRWTLFFQVLQASRDQLNEIFPDIALVVMVYPDCDTPRWVVDHIRSMQIQVFDYSDLFDNTPWTEQDLWFDDMPTSNRGHPTPLSYAIVGEQLARDLSDTYPELFDD